MFTQKKEPEFDRIVYSISLIPNKQAVIRLLGKQQLNKEQMKYVKGKPLRFPVSLFKIIYPAIQETYKKEHSANKDVSIEIMVPAFEKYTVLIDTKKISRQSFLTLLQESIVQEDDVKTANNLYQQVVNDFCGGMQELEAISQQETSVRMPAEKQNKLRNPPSVTETPNSPDAEKRADEQPVASFQEALPQLEVVQEESSPAENQQAIKIDVDYLKTVDIGKKKLSVVDPEYEKEKYNQEARKVNKLLNQCATKLEKDVGSVYKNKSDELEAIILSESIKEQNEQIRKDNQQVLVQLYQSKEQELDQKKRENIFSLNEDLEKEQKELKLTYEKQVHELNESFFKKKNKAIATLDYQFDTWLTTEFQSAWNEHYKDLKEKLSSIENRHSEALAEKQQQLTNDLQEYLKEVKPAYNEAAQNYLDKRKPELKKEILSDIAIYQKQTEAKQLSETLTKREVAKLLEEQEQRLQKSLEVKKDSMIQAETTVSTKAESTRTIRIHAFFQKWVSKKVKIAITVFFSVSVFFGLGFSVYKKITYVPPFDTMISSKEYEVAIKNYPNQRYEVVDILYDQVLAGDTTALSELKKINKENPTALADFDLSIFNQEYDEALQTYQKNKKKVPDSYWRKRYAVIGYCCLKNGQLTEAETYQEKSKDQVLLEKIHTYKELNQQINSIADQLTKAKEQIKRIDDQKEREQLKIEIQRQEKAVDTLKNDLKNI